MNLEDDTKSNASTIVIIHVCKRGMGMNSVTIRVHKGLGSIKQF